MAEPVKIPEPFNVAKLPRCPRRNIPVPWFVHWPDRAVEPDFRIMDHFKFRDAVCEDRCWVCGEPMGVNKVFVIGPMCGINRISSEPPSHYDCAVYSVKACPFLSKPHMERRRDRLPETREAAGIMIERNPGVTLLWTTRTYSVIKDGHGGLLIEIGNPQAVQFWSAGRLATREEIIESVESGLPIIREMCKGDLDSLAQVEEQRKWLMTLLPPPA